MLLYEPWWLLQKALPHSFFIWHRVLIHRQEPGTRNRINGTGMSMKRQSGDHVGSGQASPKNKDWRIRCQRRQPVQIPGLGKNPD